MKITKRQLRQIIKEEKARLLSEMDRDAMMDLEARERASDAKMDVLDGVDELMAAIKKGARLGVDKGAAEDELYIMTGGAEGLTVKVVRRGR